MIIYILENVNKLHTKSTPSTDQICLTSFHLLTDRHPYPCKYNTFFGFHYKPDIFFRCIIQYIRYII